MPFLSHNIQYIPVSLHHWLIDGQAVQSTYGQTWLLASLRVWLKRPPQPSPPYASNGHKWREQWRHDGISIFLPAFFRPIVLMWSSPCKVSCLKWDMATIFSRVQLKCPPPLPPILHTVWLKINANFFVLRPLSPKFNGRFRILMQSYPMMDSIPFHFITSSTKCVSLSSLHFVCIDGLHWDINWRWSMSLAEGFPDHGWMVSDWNVWDSLQTNVWPAMTK